MKTLSFKNQAEFVSHLKLMNVGEFTLITSGLESKKYFVNQLSKIYETIPDELVLRLNEFFVRLVKKIKPEIEFIDKKLFLEYVVSNLQEFDITASQKQNIEKSINALSIFSAVFSNTVYDEIFEDYINSEESLGLTFREIYTFMKSIWSIVNKTNFLIQQWSLGWLFKNIETLEPESLNSIYILNPEFMKKVELDFFEELSHRTNVYLVTVEDIVLNKNKNDINQGAQAKLSWTKLETPVDEIESAFEIITEKKYELSNCHFVIPQNVPSYAHGLEILSKMYLNSDMTLEIPQGIKSNLICSRVLKKIILMTKNQDELYSSSDIKKIADSYKNEFKTYSEFKKNLNQILKLEDLKINKVDLNFNEKIKSISKPLINFAKFIEIVTDILLDEKLKSSEEEKDVFLKYLKSKVIQIPQVIEMHFGSWIEYFNQALTEYHEVKTSIEIKVSKIDELEFNSEVNYFILGCTQQNYEVSMNAYLSDLDIEKIKMDLGFNFESKEFSDSLYQKIKKLKVTNKSVNLYFLSSSYNFNSEKHNFPKFLLKLEKEYEFENPKIKSADYVLDRSYNPNLDLLNETSGGKDWLAGKLRSAESASSLNKYAKCPYIYFNDYIFKKDIEQELDYEISPRLVGSIFHLVLEKGLDNKELNSNTVTKWISKEIDKEYSGWMNKDVIQKQILRKVNNLVEYVKQDIQQKQSENRKTVFKELDVIAYFSKSDMKFRRIRQADSDIKFRAKIDRIDSIENHVYIFDYKTSKATSYLNWSKEFQYQMPIYAMLFMDGLIDIDGRLSQLSYLIINEDFKYQVGLAMKSKNKVLNLNTYLSKSNSVQEDIDFKNKIDGFRNPLADILNKISELNFAPDPIDVNQCKKCDYKDICYAKHLL